MARPVQVEWPTVAVAVGVYGAWLALLFGHERLPGPVLVVGLGLVAAWHGSLQHEAIHGHPTRHRWLNDAMAAPPLLLWLPYQHYRATHIRHHAARLTIPGEDPETFYVSAETWARAGRLRRSYWWLMRTLAGRMIVGPLTHPAAFWHAQFRCAPRMTPGQFARHLVFAASILGFAVGIAGIPVGYYLLGCCYLGTSLTLLRSFVEHLAVDDPAPSAVVRSGRFFGLLYLNNNLHYTHHAMPGAAWYRLGGLTDSLGAAEAAARGAGTYRGYGEIVWRYAFRPFAQPWHPAPIIGRP